jgi:hypothetical protein
VMRSPSGGLFSLRMRVRAFWEVLDPPDSSVLVQPEPPLPSD